MQRRRSWGRRSSGVRPVGGRPDPGWGGSPYDAAIVATSTSGRAAGAVSFPAFEGVRAVAALAVVVFHAGVYGGFTWGVAATDHRPEAWIRHLDVAVSVFFVVSAFLLYRSFVLAHLRAGPPPDRRRYLVRRLTRLFPAYWLALAVGVFGFGFSSDLDRWGLTRLFLLIQVYWRDTAAAGLPQAWSLNTELAFYLLLPVWARALRRFGRSRAGAVRAQYLGCVALAVTGLTVRAAVRHLGDADHVLFWLPANLDVFALGMALAVASAASTARGGSAHDGLPGPLRLLADVPAMAVAVAVVAFLGVVALDLPVDGRTGPGREVVTRVLFGVLCLAVVAPAAFGPPRTGGYRRLLAWRPLAAVGTVSYGIYLWHITVLDRVADRYRPAGLIGPWRSGAMLLVTAGIVGSLVLATISWFGVERPLLRRARGVEAANRAR